MTLMSMGIDPSTTATGIVLLSCLPECKPTVRYADTIPGDKKAKGFEKHQIMVLQIMTLVDHWKPDALVIEGYSLNLKNASSVVPLVELGGLLRFMFYIDGRTWYDPRASELKKFVTGKGNVGKEFVMMGVLKKWGFEANSNDVADAFGLAAMGLAAMRVLPGSTKDMQKVADSMVLRTN